MRKQPSWYVNSMLYESVDLVFRQIQTILKICPREQTKAGALLRTELSEYVARNDCNY